MADLQRLQPHAAGADPLRQGGAGDGQIGAAKDALLPVQRQMIGVLGHQHPGQRCVGPSAHVRRPWPARRHRCGSSQQRAQHLSTGVGSVHRPMQANLHGVMLELDADAGWRCRGLAFTGQYRQRGGEINRDECRSRDLIAEQG